MAVIPRKPADSSADPTVQAWRRRYESTATADSWLTTHHWRYGEEVAAATAADVRDKLTLTADDRVVEIGVGTGAFLISVLHPSQKGIGFDFCHALVKRGRAVDLTRRRVSFGVAEAVRLPVADHTFDRVLCYSVTQYFPNEAYARSAMLEMLRVCRPGGVALIGDVCGILERPQRWMRWCGLPERLIEASLTLMSPLRRLRFSGKLNDGLDYRRYRRSFFRRVFKGQRCEVEILDQHIEGRTVSGSRFDVRLIKHPTPSQVS